jgi:hypothetical protein
MESLDDSLFPGELHDVPFPESGNPWVGLLGKLVFLLLAGLVIWGLWRAGRPPLLFTVRVRGGEPSPTAGKVTLVFLRQVREVAAEYGVLAGRVHGEVRRGGRVGLGFSVEFPAAAQQKLRNWWATFGWVAGKRRA